MPELPDLDAYLHALRARMLGSPLNGIRLKNPFLLRSVTPPLPEFNGLPVEDLFRIGKRLVLAFPGERYLVLHLMVLGRLHWKPPGAPLSGKNALAAFDFSGGSLHFTESGTKKRASLHAVAGRENLDPFRRGGIEPLEADLEAFRAALTRENHTLKRCLTDPRLFSGIGNAYSDEILHRARLSPLALSQKLSAADVEKLYRATQTTLTVWRDRLVAEAEQAFPEKVTAFRPDMAVHGRYGLPCPDCGTPVQRIRYAENETNYCPVCQTGGQLLADRAWSRLLKQDWPRSLEALEEMKTALSARTGGLREP